MSDDQGNFDPLGQLGETLETALVGQGPTPTPKSEQERRFKQRRVNLIQSLYEDKDIDEISRTQIVERLNQFDPITGKNKTGETFDVATEISRAKEAKGIYGINRKNSELIRQMREKPGRQQTILTQGAKELSGTESAGILTGMNK